MSSVTKYIIILALCMLPLSAWCGEGNAEVKKETPAATWKDIKNVPGPVASDIPEIYTELMKNFKEYWDAMKAKDYKKAYDLESSEHRKMTSFDLYNERLKGAVQIIAVRPLEVKPVNEKEVMVRSSLGYKAGLVDTVRLMHDRWIKEESGWRHLPAKEKKDDKKEEKKEG